MKEYLEYLESFNRYNCPEYHYIAWKIFVLRTDEYNIDRMLSSFKYSYNKWKEGIK